MSLLKILENYSWAEGPETTISFSNSLGLRSLCVVILRAMSFHSKRIQNITEGKGVCGGVQGKPGTSFQNRVAGSPLTPPAADW